MKKKSNLEIKVKKDEDGNKIRFDFDLEKLSEKEFQDLFELISYKFNVILKTFQISEKIENTSTNEKINPEDKCDT